MFFVCRIPFGTSELKIKTLEEIPDKDAEEISYFLKAFHSELNHNLVNTSAYNFNQAQIGIPIFLKKEFMEFLLQNIEFSVRTNYKYFPFKPDLRTISPREDIVFDSSSSTITKFKEVYFDSSVNKKHFTIDILSDFLLKELGFKNFLISSDSVHLARGGVAWEINLDNTLGKDMVVEIKNEAIVIEPAEPQYHSATKFGVLPTDVIRPEYIFLQSPYSAFIKVLSTFAKHLSSNVTFNNFANTFDIQIGIIDADDAITSYKPYSLK